MSRVTIIPKKKYLSLPVSSFVGQRSVRIYDGGRLADDFTCRLDLVDPTYRVFYDMSRFEGKEFTLETVPNIELSPLAGEEYQRDEIKYDTDSYRMSPRVHFTAPFGWINDPNGLFVYTSPVTGKTLYHMFCQHNPYDSVWGNMHWGHAVSEDMVHWSYLGEALVPDENGTVFSGSAVVDYNNRSGLKDGDECPILLFYTCAGHTSVISAGKEFTQCMAYSTDGGMTFKKYEKNPVIGHIAEENRDPKVIWCDEIGRYILALYLKGNDYCIFTSENLLSWNELQRITLDGDAECPDIYPLVTKKKERRWIFSGASDFYIVGEFRDGLFRPVTAPKKLSYSSASYAAQTFSCRGDNDPADESAADTRRLRFAWDRNTTFGNDPICSQMSIPCEMTLKNDGGQYTLCANPAAEISVLKRESTETRGIEITSDAPFTVTSLRDSAYMLEIALGEIKTECDITLEVFGQTVTVSPSSWMCSVMGNELPLTVFRDKVELCMIIDRASLEVFADGGRAIITVPWRLDFNMNTLRITSECASLKSLRVTRLEK